MDNSLCVVFLIVVSLNVSSQKGSALAVSPALAEIEEVYLEELHSEELHSEDPKDAEKS